MADKTRTGRGIDDRDVVRKSRAAAQPGEPRRDAAATERMGREAQRRATAYGRARGQL